MKQLLTIDALAGGLTALIGLFFYKPLTTLLGLPTPLILAIAGITLLYALVALTLCLSSQQSRSLLRLLVLGNWFWTLTSVALCVIYWREATGLGALFLVLQPLAVGGLAYLEGELINVI